MRSYRQQQGVTMLMAFFQSDTRDAHLPGYKLYPRISRSHRPSAGHVTSGRTCLSVVLSLVDMCEPSSVTSNVTVVGD